MKLLRNWLGKPKYQIKKGAPWTLHEVLTRLSDELAPCGAQLDKSKLLFADRKDITIEFIRNRFPPNDNMVEINGSILLEREGDVFVADLFHLGKQYFRGEARPLGIHKDEAWEGSQMQEQVQKFYLPLMQEILKLPSDTLTSPHLEVTINGVRITVTSA